MPTNKGVNRDCPICNCTGRSDVIRRHVLRIHGKAEIPPGWKVASAQASVWIQIRVLDRVKMMGDFPKGLCMSCGVTIINKHDKKTNVDCYNTHVCHKQVRDRSVITPKPVKETVKPVVKEPIKPAPDDDDSWAEPAVDLSELYDGLIDHIDQLHTVSLKTKQEVVAMLEGLQEDEEPDHNKMIEMAFTKITESLEESYKTNDDLHQQIRRLQQENWKLKSQIPDPEELTLIITD